MLALEIRLNGEHKATCGAEDLDSIVTWVRATRNGAESPRDFEFFIECSGSWQPDPETNEIVKWVSARLALGDEITLRFVDTALA